LPEEKLAFAYTSNAKVHPVRDIMSEVIEIYYNKPFQIPTFETSAVSAEVLDKYVGVYSSPEAPREIYDHQKRRHAFRSAGQSIRCSARSDGRG
jgi:hypothetical protein